MKKMTEYVVAGVLADNKEVFLKRVGELLEQKNLLELLTDGVPVMVRITDADELLKAIIKMDTSYSKKACEILKVRINADFHVEVNFRHVYEQYFFKTEEDKKAWEEDSWSYNNAKREKSKTATEEFTIVGTKYSTSTIEVPTNTEGIEVAFV